MARWINVTKVFDYRWPDEPAITAFTERDFGDQLVKDELADFAVKKGYATDGKADASSRSSKGRKPGKAKSAAKAANRGSDDAVALPNMAVHDRAAGGQPLDPDAK